MKIVVLDGYTLNRATTRGMIWRGSASSRCTTARPRTGRRARREADIVLTNRRA